MAHFAQLDENNIVIFVTPLADSILKNRKGEEEEQRGIDYLTSHHGGIWKQTSYYTFLGVNRRGNPPLRKNYAGLGYSYDPVRDAFIPPKPFPSWVLDEETCSWVSSVPAPPNPIDGTYVWRWDEERMLWYEWYIHE